MKDKVHLWREPEAVVTEVGESRRESVTETKHLTVQRQPCKLKQH